MAKKRDTGRNQPRAEDERALSRRDFVKAGAAVGLGGAVLSAPGEALAQQSASDIAWNYEADVVACGAGATGLAAAIRARDAGLSVIVLDQNFDVGGRMLHSGGQVSLGGGDPVQIRDIKGESDKEGFVTVPPIHAPEELTEDPDFLFRDVTDWSVLDAGAQPIYRFTTGTCIVPGRTIVPPCGSSSSTTTSVSAASGAPNPATASGGRAAPPAS